MIILTFLISVLSFFFIHIDFSYKIENNDKIDNNDKVDNNDEVENNNKIENIDIYNYLRFDD